MLNISLINVVPINITLILLYIYVSILKKKQILILDVVL